MLFIFLYSIKVTTGLDRRSTRHSSSPSRWLVKSYRGLLFGVTTRWQCFTLKLGQRAAPRSNIFFSLHGWRHHSCSGRPPSVVHMPFSSVAREAKEAEQTPSNFRIFAPSGVHVYAFIVGHVDVNRPCLGRRKHFNKGFYWVCQWQEGCKRETTWCCHFKEKVLFLLFFSREILLKSKTYFNLLLQTTAIWHTDITQ